jgi:hypothetical protein
VSVCLCVFLPPGLGAQNSLLSIETARLVVVPRELGTVCFLLLFSLSLSLSPQSVRVLVVLVVSAPFCCFFFLC